MGKFRTVVVCGVISAVFLGVPSGCGIRGGLNAPSHKYVREMEVAGAMQGGRRLDVEASNGSIEVAGWDEAKCVVKAKITARGWSEEEAKAIAEGVEISLVENGDTTVVAVKKPESALSRHLGISFEISAPEDSLLKLGTSNGSVRSRGVRGDMDLRTSNGTVSARGAAGEVRARSSNGNVEIVFPDDAAGAVFVDAETSNGSIHMKGPEEMSAKIEASTSNGSVRTGRPVAISGEMKKTRLRGTMGEGKGQIRLHTSNGSINIE